MGLELCALCIIDQNIGVVHVVVIVLEAHDSTLKRSIPLYLHLCLRTLNESWHLRTRLFTLWRLAFLHLFLAWRWRLKLDLWNFDTSLEEVSREDHGVREELSEVSNPLYSLDILLYIYVGLQIWITRAMLNLVPYLLAAVTPHILLLLLLILAFGITSIIILIVLALMLSELAASGILRGFTTTPPHLTAPIALMSSA